MVRTSRLGLPAVLIGVIPVVFGLLWQDSQPEPQDGQTNVTVAGMQQEPATVAQKQEPAPEDPFVPLDDMHHFMEYVCQPRFQALKESLKEEPKERRAWRGIKSDAMILAESSALLAARIPENADGAQVKLWKQISLDVYTAGKGLYQANGDFAKAREAYELMVDNCNHCHQEFAGGNHQLKK